MDILEDKNITHKTEPNEAGNLQNSGNVFLSGEAALPKPAEDAFLSLAEASKLTGYHQDYLGFLCRTGKLNGFKIGRNWVIAKPALDEFIKNYKNGISEVVDETGNKIPVHVIAPLQSQAIAQSQSGILPGQENTQEYNKQNFLAKTVIAAQAVPFTAQPNNGASQESAQILGLSNLKKEVLENLEQRIEKISESVSKIETGRTEKNEQTEQTYAFMAPAPAQAERPELAKKFASNFDIVSLDAQTDAADGQNAKGYFSKEKIKDLYQSFTQARKNNLPLVFAALAIALIGLVGSLLVSNFATDQRLAQKKDLTEIFYGQGKTGQPQESNQVAVNNNSGSQAFGGTQIINQLLGLSQSQVFSMIDDRLNQYMAEGKFKGQTGAQGLPGAQGAQGPAGYAGTPIVYAPGIPGTNSTPGSVGGFGDLSANSFSSDQANLTNLTVQGNSVFNSAATFSGPTTLNGTTTIANLSLNNLDLGFSQGSVVFQGSNGLAQDNANLFYSASTTNPQFSIGTNTPSSSATLELDSTSGGFLAPRMAQAQMDAIASPAAGLMVYNTDTNQYNVFNGTIWQAIGTGSGGSGSGGVATGTPGSFGYYAGAEPSITPQSVLFISGNNIGVGTNAPASTLFVQGTSTAPSVNLFVAASSSGSTLFSIGPNGLATAQSLTVIGSTTLADLTAGSTTLNTLSVTGTSALATATISSLSLGQVLGVSSGGIGTGTLGNLSLGSGLDFTSGDGRQIIIGTSTSIGLSSSVITNIATGTAGNIFNIATSTNNLTINLPFSSISSTGQLLASDWATFNNKLSGSGTANYLVKYTGASTTASSVIYDNGTNVGIGTTTPGSALTVVGNGYFSGNLTANGNGVIGGGLNVSGAASAASLLISGNATTTGNLIVLGNQSVTGTSTLATTTITALALSGGLQDSTNALGFLGSVLISTGTSTLWTATSTLGLQPAGNYVTNSYASSTFPTFTYASSTFATYNYASSTFDSFSYASSTFPTFSYASSTFQLQGSYVTNSYASTTFPSFAYASSTFNSFAYSSSTFPSFTYGSSTYATIANYPTYSYASSTFVTYPYASSTFPTFTYASSTFPSFTYASSTFQLQGSYVTNAYASTTFPSFTYASNTFATILNYPTYTYASNTFATLLNTPSFTYGSSTYVNFGYASSTYATIANYPTYTYASNTFATILNYPNYNYASSTFNSFGYSSSTFPSFTYGTSTYATIANYPTYTYASNTFATLLNTPTYTYGSSTYVNYSYASSTFPSFTYASSTFQAAGTYVTSVSGAGSILSSGGTTPTIQLQNLTSNDILFGQGNSTIATSTNFVFNSTTRSLGINSSTPQGTLVVEASTSAQTLPVLNVASTSGASFLAVTPAGNVGIGTSTPSYPLHIVNGANAEQLGEFDLATSTFGGQAYIGFGGPRGYVGFDGTNGNMAVQGTTNKGIEFNVNNNTFGIGTAMLINSAGNVGIGTITPTSTLFVQGTTTTNILAVASSTGASLFQVTSAGNVNVATLTASSLVMADANKNLQSVTLGTGLSFSGNTLNASGSFSGSGTNGQAAYFTSGTNITSAADFLNNGTVAGINATSSTVAFNIQGANTLDPFQITSSTGASLLVVKASGNVGIGTATPTATLAVEGTSSQATLPVFVVASSSNAQILTVTSAGNVGIGSSTPSARLAVSSVQGTGYSLNLTQTGGNASNFISVNNAGTNLLDFSATAQGNPYLNIKDVNSVTAIGLSATGTSYFIGGNIGIGKTTAAATLDINATTALSSALPILRLAGTDGGTAPSAGSGLGIAFQNINGNRNLRDIAALQTTWTNVTQGGEQAALDLFVATASTTSATRLNDVMRLTGAGNVGIGTTSPAALLFVQSYSVSSTTPTLVVRATSTQTSAIASFQNGSGSNLVNIDSLGNVNIATVTASSLVGTDANHNLIGETLLAGSNITITTSTVGQITIAASGSTGVSSVTGSGSILSSGGSTPNITLQNLTSSDILFGQGNGTIATSSLFTFSAASGLNVNATSTLATTPISRLTLGNGLISSYLAVDQNGNVIVTSTPAGATTINGFSGPAFTFSTSTTGSGTLTITGSGSNIQFALNTSSLQPAGSYVTNSYASSTFPTFTYASSTFDSFSYASSTFPSFSYGTSTYATIANYPTYSYASSTYALSSAFSGTNGQVAYFNSGSNITSAADFLNNGSVVGVNATSSTVNFNIQGTGTNNPFNVASSSGASELIVASAGNVGINTTTPDAQLAIASTPSTELVTNGTFTGSAAGWTLGTGWTYGSNEVTHTPSDTGNLSQSVNVVAGRTYNLSYTVVGSTTGCLLAEVGSQVVSGVFFGNQNYTNNFTANSSGSLIFDVNDCDPGFDGSIDNVSLQALAPALAVHEANGSMGFLADNSGNVQVANEMAVGNSSSVGGGPLVSAPPGILNTILDVEATGTSNSAVLVGTQSDVEINPTVDSSFGSIGLSVNSESAPDVSDTHPIEQILGASISASHNGTGELSQLIGNGLNVSNSGSGLVDALYGQQISMGNNSNGTVTAAVGLDVSASYNAGTIGSRTGVLVESADNGYGGGSIGNNYGLYIQDQSGSGTSSSFNLYSAGSGINYFGGNVGIGTTNPGNALEINGDGSGKGLRIQAYSGDAHYYTDIYQNYPGAFNIDYNTNGYSPENVFSAQEDTTSLSSTYGAITFNTHGAERARIDNNGNVGIGMNNPQYPLDVTGSADVNQNLYVGGAGGNGSDDGKIFVGYGSGFNLEMGSYGSYVGINTNDVYNNQSLVLQDNGGNVGIGTSTPNQTLTIQGSGANDIFNVASSSGASDLYVASNGNVGIDTTTPAAPLDINTGANGDILFGQDSTTPGYNMLSFNTNLTDTGNIGFAAGGAGDGSIYVDTPSNGALNMERGVIGTGYEGDTAPTNGLIVQGNVGIGKNNPGVALDVNGDAGVSGNIYNGGEYFNYSANQTQILLNSVGSDCGTIQNDATDTWSLGYGTACDTTLGTNVLTWNASGNVGIGTITPTSTLFVQGTTTNSILTAASSSGVSLFQITSAGNVNIATLTASSLVVTDANKNLASSNINVNNIISNISTGTTSGVFNISTSTNSLVINFPNNLVTNSYASSTFDSFGYSSSTFPTFSYASSTFQTVLTNPNTGTGSGGQVAYFTGSSATALSSGLSLLNNGSVAGVNATSSTVDFTIQGTSGGTNALFNIASSTPADSFFKVLAGGNIGIGTITPTSVLMVEGTSSAATADLFSVASSTGTKIFDITSNGNINIATSTAGQLLGVDANKNVIGETLLAGTNITVTSSTLGQITIAASATAAGGLPGQDQYNNNGAFAGGISLLNNGTVAGVNATSSTVDFTIQGTSGGTNALFNVASSSPGSSFLKVLANGLVGIGSSTPIATLSVEGTSTLATTDLFDVASSTGAKIFSISSAGNVKIATTTASEMLLTDANGNVQSQAMGGDATLNYTNGNLTLATVNSNVGTFGGASNMVSVTVNGKGLVTAISSVTPSIPSGDITGVLPVANGGTGAQAVTANDILFGNGTSPLATSTNLTFNSSSNLLSLGAGNFNIATLTSSSLVMTDAGKNLTSVSLGTGLSFTGLQLNASNAFTGSGSGGEDAFWTTGTNLSSGLSLLNNGTVSGVNATSSTVDFTIQGTSGGTNALFNVASSTPGTAFLKVLANGLVGIGSSTPIATLSVEGTSTLATTDLFDVASSTGAKVFSVTAGGNVNLPSTTVSSLAMTDANHNLTSASLGTGLSFTGLQLNASNAFTGSGANNQVNFWTSATAQSGSASFLWDNTAKALVINSSTPIAEASLFVAASTSAQTLPIFEVGSTTGATFLKVTAAGDVNIATTTASQVLETSASNAVISAATLSAALGGTGATSIAGANILTSTTGGIGQAAYFSAATVLSSATSLLNNGTVAGVNATSSTVDFTIQGTSGGTNALFNIASSTPADSFFKVLAGGNIGIGTITPTSVLMVEGTSSAATADLFSVASSTGTKIFDITSNNNVNIATLTASSLVGTDANKNLIGETLLAGSNVTITTSTAGQITIAASGGAPGGTPGQVQYNNNAAFAAGIGLLDNGTVSGVNATSSTVDFTIQGTSGGTNALFNVASSTPGSSFLKVLANGLVGIGSSTPIATLSVEGTSTLPTTNLFVVASSTGANYLTVLANGNVGIGTTTPSQALQVVNSISNVLTTGSALSIVGSANVGGGPRNLAVQGRYAYVINSASSTMSVMDISNPLSPVQISTTTIGLGARDIAVSGRYAYIVDNASSDLRIIDISNPYSPALVSITSFPSSPLDAPLAINLSGKYAYIAMGDTPGELAVVDISNPYSPAIVGSVNAGGAATLGIISGRYYYAVNYSSNNVSIIDISNPANPVFMASTTVGSGPDAVAVSGRYAYVANSGDNTVSVVDISNPSAPVQVATTSVVAYPIDISLQGRYLYITGYSGGALGVVDISNPVAPVQVTTITTGTNPIGLFVAGRYAYVTNNGNNNFKVIDITGTETTSLTAGSADVGSLQVRNDIYAMGQLQVAGGLQVANGAQFMGPVGIYVPTSTSASVFSITASSSSPNILTVLGNGNVGIGTSTPIANLNVSGNTNNGVVELVNNANSGTGAYASIQAAADVANVFMQSYSSGLSGSRWGVASAGWSEISSSAGNGMILGPRNSTPLILGTGSNEKMRIDSSGNIGIGTTSPAQLLQVAGNIGIGSSKNVNGNLVFYDSANANTVTLRSTTTLASSYTLTLPTAQGSSGQTLQNDGNGNLSWTSPGAASISIGSSITGSTNGSVLFVSSNDLQQSNSNFFWNNSGDQLGIGTSTTSALLTLQGPAGTASILNIASSSGASLLRVTAFGGIVQNISSSTALNIEDGSGNAVFTVDTTQSTDHGIDITAASGQTGLLLNAASSSGASMFVVAGSGNVGIGTSTPNDALDIYAPQSTGLRIVDQAQGDGIDFQGWYPAINFNNYFDPATSVARGIGPDYTGSIVMDPYSGNIAFNTGNDPGSNATATLTTAMEILDNGNVGIGTTTPGQALSVAGNILSNNGGNTAENVLIGDETPNGGYPGIWLGAAAGAPSYTNYSFLSNGSGGSLFNSASGQDTEFRINNSSVMDVSASAVESVVPWIAQGSGVYGEVFNTTVSGSSQLFLAANNGSSAEKYFTFQETASDATNGALYIIPNSSANSSAVMAIQSGGNVGIGTISPTSVLMVQGQSGSINQLFEVASSSGQSYLHVTAAGNVGINSSSPQSTFAVQVNGAVNPFMVASSTGGNYFQILANGNVGIGTSTPQAQLSVLDIPATSGALILQVGSTTNTSMLDVLGNGNVGIGTASPSSLLQVAGAVGLGLGKTTAGSLVFQDSSDLNTLTFKAPSSIATGFTLTLPNTAGLSGQTLMTDGSGNLSWASTGFAVNASSSAVMALSTTNKVYVDATITPSNTGASVWITGDVAVTSTPSTVVNERVSVSVERGGGSQGATCVASQVGLVTTTIISTSTDISVNFIDAPATTSSKGYELCVTLGSGTTPVAIGGQITLVEVRPGSDLAETYYSTSTNITAGQVVTGDSSIEGGVQLDAQAYDNNIMGVVSTNPGQVMVSGPQTGTPVLLALNGRVPVQIATDTPINAGDYLTSSDIPGLAMKAEHSGEVIGQALESFDPSTNTNPDPTIMVFVKPGFQLINNTFVLGANDGQLVNATSTLTNDSSELATSFLIDQQGSGNILQLQDNEQDRFLVASSGSVSILANVPTSTASTTVLSVVNASATLFTIDSVGDVTTTGHIIVGADSAGTATIAAGQNTVTVTFTQPYLNPPKVIATVDGMPDFFYGVTNKTSTGFTISTSQLVSQDTSFDWVAIEQDGTSTGQSGVNLSVISAPSSGGGSSISDGGSSGSSSDSGGQVAGDSTTTPDSGSGDSSDSGSSTPPTVTPTPAPTDTPAPTPTPDTSTSSGQ